MTLKIPLYALVWKLSYDLEREIKFLKHFTVLVRLIGIWSRPKDENVLPEYTSQKIGLDLKISSLITSFHQTQFIWKAKLFGQTFFLKTLVWKTYFLFGKYNTNTSPYKSHKYNMNFYRYLLFGMQNFCFVIFIFSSGFVPSLFIKKNSIFQKQTSREDIRLWLYLHIFVM